MKRHLKHLAMCAPMIVIAVILLATGSGVGVLIPLVACTLMMVLMMNGMGAHGHSDRGGGR